MSQAQFIQTVAAEEEWQYEVRRRQEMDADDIAEEMAKGRDDEFTEALADRFPVLKSWPGKDRK